MIHQATVSFAHGVYWWMCSCGHYVRDPHGDTAAKKMGSHLNVSNGYNRNKLGWVLDASPYPQVLHPESDQIALYAMSDTS